MTAPASYTGRARVGGKFAAFERSLNPLYWPATAAYLWTAVWLIPPVDPVDPGDPPLPVPGSDPVTNLPRSRSADPARAPDRDSWDSAKLYEAARFGSYLYRNVLLTSLQKTGTGISFRYEQAECLDTLAHRRCDGGIAVDHGGGSAEQDGDFVNVTVSKTVQFTQPAAVVSDVNLLAHVMVPLAFDFWLQSGIFGGK